MQSKEQQPQNKLYKDIDAQLIYIKKTFFQLSATHIVTGTVILMILYASRMLITHLRAIAIVSTIMSFTFRHQIYNVFIYWQRCISYNIFVIAHLLYYY